MTGTATLSVTLLDINDHAPDFQEGEQEFVIPATASVGYEIGRIYGLDLDTEANGPPFTFDWQCNEPYCTTDLDLRIENSKHIVNRFGAHSEYSQKLTIND